jgi:hypothetical protein
MSALAPEESPSTLRLFFVVMASAVIITVFAGFAPTFYLRGSFAQSRPMSVLLHVHGIVFSTWVSFFLVQTLLVARGSRRLHQRLGWIGAGIAARHVSLRHSPHWPERHGQSLDCFDAAGRCIFPALLCLRLTDPTQNPSCLPGRVTRTPSRVRGRCESRRF